MKKFYLYIPIYGEGLTFLLGKDKKDHIEYLHKHKPKGFTDTWVQTVDRSLDGRDGACYVSFNEENDHYICLQRKPKNTHDLSIINHELLHITHRILSKRGIHLITETEEAYTYLQQWLFNEFCNAFNISKLK